ncbi:MAG: DUF4386 family protein [Boseongicola sp.]|nr:MAG: DUF4386 family protein [Boseongicola sp.]
MTTTTLSESRSYARTAGLGYLAIAVAGGYSIAYVPSQIFGAANPDDTLHLLQANRGLFLSGILGDLIMMAAELLVTVMLFNMFKSVQPTLSAAAALARFSMVTVMAAMLFFYGAAMAVSDGAIALSSFTPAQQNDVANLLIHMHDSGVWIWQVFFTIHLLLLGILIVRSDHYPTLLGVALAVGGMGYFMDSIYAFAFPDAALLGTIRIGFLAVVTLAELSFALWLVFIGPRSKAGDKHRAQTPAQSATA